MSALPTGVGPGEGWHAPRALSPVNATVDVPGSKSLTARYLVLAALADGPVTIQGALRSRDTDLMAAALRALGVEVDDAGVDWTVQPAPLQGGKEIFCGLAGTVMRFVPPMALLADGPLTFDGDPAARVRPMGPLLDALRALGAEVEDEGRGTLPCTVTPPAQIPAEVEVDTSTSSQFVTALLLVAPRLPQGLTVRHVGHRLPSLPHIDMTCENLRDAGVQVDQPDKTTWVVHPGPIRMGNIRVEPDLSNAGPFMAAALAAGGTVRIPHWPTQTTQPGALYPEIFTQLGATCTVDEDIMTVTSDGQLRGIDVDLSRAGEITPTVAALCTLAQGPSRITGIGHLRGHETDRLEAIVQAVRAIGGECEAGDDWLEFGGQPAGGFNGAVLESHEDHRMATFNAIVGLAIDDITVINVGTTSKTMPDFPDMWTAMLGA